MRNLAIHSEPGKLTAALPFKFNAISFFLFPVCAAGCVAMFIASKNSILFGIVLAALLLPLLLSWIAHITGKEVVAFTPSQLTYRSGAFGSSRRETFQMSQIRAPRFIRWRPGRFGMPTGLGFYYEGIPAQICDGISEAQAGEIVAALLCQFPELASVWGRYNENTPELELYFLANWK